MTAIAVRSTVLIPGPRTAGDDVPASDAAPSLRDGSTCRAVAYQRVVHRLVRRELRLLADLATWAPDDEAERTATLTRHAELVGKVLLHHHAVERDSVWPALLRTVPDDAMDEVHEALELWTACCARIDHMLRDVSTAARQWCVAATPPARRAFAASCRALAEAVDAQTDDEERALLPLLEAHLEPEDWSSIAESAHCRLTRPGAAHGDRPGAGGLQCRRARPAARRSVPRHPLGLAPVRRAALPGRRRPAARGSAGALSRQ